MRDAFDTLVATAIAQPDYTVSPSWHGDIRQFNYEDAGSAERPFAFIVNRGHLLFYVRQPGLRRIAGGFPGLKDQFDSAQENSRGEWTVRIASREDAERLDAFLFRPSAPDQSGIPDGSRRDGPEAAATTDKPWRTNPQAAGELLDAVLSGVAPDTHRLCVEALIHSIAFAKDHFPDSWVVTLNPDHVRFIVGMVMCLQLRKDGGGSILLLKRVTPPKLRKNGGEYRYAPGCVEVSLTLEELAEQYSPLMEAHEAAILACAQAHAGSGGHRQAHSPGLVAYLTGQAEAGDATSLVNTAGDHDQDPDAYADRAVFSRIDLGPTEKQTLVNARRGQGLFRERVVALERRCRVTGIELIDHLRASHIKPWKDSSDQEKLDGNNGLLLAPHIDHLFDQGFISFTDFGDLIISPKCPAVLCTAWGVDASMNVGPFRLAQRGYLAYHRAHVLKP